MAVRSGRFIVEVTADGGHHWTTRPGAGLPVIDVASYLSQGGATLISLIALTTNIAFTMIETMSGRVTYVTMDGGARWSPLTSLTF